MKIGIRYEARYRYAQKVGLSPHAVRIFPRADVHLHVDRTRFETHRTGDIQYRRDLFDNVIASVFFPEPLDEMEFRLELDLEIAERNPFHFLLDSHALKVPFEYWSGERAFLQPALRRVAPEVALPGEVLFTKPTATVEALVQMNGWIFKNFAYERRDLGDAHLPAETLVRGRGACRDFAVLLLDILRANGIAARLASGFLWEPDEPEGERKAENALHAWVEAYVPGPGWIGLDPTNGVLCDHHFIASAVGLTVEDIKPVAGSYYGLQKIESELFSSLRIESLEARS